MNKANASADVRGDEVYLLDYLIVLAKHSRMIIYSTLVVSALTLLILLFVPNKYTATARIMPPQQNMTLSAQILDQLGGSALPGMGGAAGLGGMAASLLGLKSPGDLYVGILCGNTVFDRIIEQFKLKEYYQSWYEVLLAKVLPLKGPYIEDIRKELSSQVDIIAGKDGLISVEVTDEDPQLATKMADAFIKELDTLLQGMALREAQSRLAFLEREREKVVGNLVKAEDNLRAFSEQSSVLQIEAQTKGVLEYIATLRATIDAREVQLQVMRQQATPYNYDVIRLETELQGLKAKLKDMEAQEGLNLREGNPLLATSRVPALGLEYLRLYREVKYQETLYELFSKLVEMARLDQVRDAAIINVVDFAAQPEKKSKPKRLLLSLVAGFVTFFLMIFVAFLKEHFQNTARAGDGEEARRLQELGGFIEKWRQDLRYLTSRLRRKKFK